MKIVCHRGANHIAPENTLLAARLCYERRYEYVELDARTSADGRLVVMHDATVDRTTNGSGAVADLTWEELSSLDAGSWFHPRFSNERIPLLSDMLSLASQMSGQLYIELKAADPRAVVEEVIGAAMIGSCFFGSEDPRAMRELRFVAPAAVLMARRRDFGSLRETVTDTNAQIIEFDVTVDDLSELSLCRKFQVLSMIYTRTDDITAMAELLDLGPDIMNVDRPDICRNVFAAGGRQQHKTP